MKLKKSNRPFRILLLCFCVIQLFSCKKGDDTTNTTTTPPVNNPPATNPPANPNIVVYSVSPASGTYNDYLQVRGRGFNANRLLDTVKINGMQANVVYADSSLLTIKVPNEAGSGPVTVKVGSDTAAWRSFLYIKSPVVTTIAGDGTVDWNTGASLLSPMNQPMGVAVDKAGNVYASEYNRIKKITPAGVLSVWAGTGARGFYDTVGAFAMFSPTGQLAIDAMDNLYMADRDNERIRKIDPFANVSTVAGNGKYGNIDGPVSIAELWEPVGVAIDSKGNVYVAEGNNQLIRKISPDGMVSTFAGTGKSGFKDGPGNQALFYNPVSIAVDRQDNLYVAEETNNRIRKITPSGDVSTLAGSGANSYANGQGTKADFARPVGVAVDKNGNVFVADYSNHVIRKITPDGMVSTYAGTPEKGGFADGPVSTAQFYYPEAVAVDDKGNVYVADLGNNRIRKIGY
jgi:sugar lactone lactonase YvrE